MLQDLFCYHSATAAAHGRAAAAQQRIKVTHLLPQLLFPATRPAGGQEAAQQQQQQEGDKEQTQDATGHDLPRHMLSMRERLVTAQQQQMDSEGNSKTRNNSSSSGTPDAAVGEGVQAAAAAAARRISTVAAGVKPGVGDAPSAAAAAAGVACPSAVLLGLDLAPNIGLHGPANFFGVASNDFLLELQQTLQQLQHSDSQQQPPPPHRQQQQYACSSGGGGMLAAPVISYSHYPFSTVAGGWTGSPYSSSSSSAGVTRVTSDAFVFGEDSFAARAEAAAAAALGEGGRALSRLLGRFDVSAHLSGHLHDLMGPHMFTNYSKEGAAGQATGRYLADLEVREGG